MMLKQQSNRPGFVRDVLRIVLPLVILAAGFAGGWLIYLQDEPPPRDPVVEKAPDVETVSAEKHEGGVDIEVDGVVVPYREIELSAEVDGRIKEKSDICRAGNYVERGTLLLKIDDEDYKLEQERLQIEVAQAVANCEELKADIGNKEDLDAGIPGVGVLGAIELAQKQLDLEEDIFKRLDELREKDSRYVAEERYDLAKQSKLRVENSLLTLRSQYKVLLARQDRLEAAKTHAEKMLEKADLNLKRTEIRFPADTDGVIVSDLVEQGDYVRIGTPLVTIEDTSKVEVKCNLRVEELSWLWNQTGLGPGRSGEEPADRAYEIPRAPVTVVYRLAGRDYEWDGMLDRYDGVGLDQATRTVPCRVLVDAPRGGSASTPDAQGGQTTGPPALVRGMYVTVRVHGRPQAPLVSIPEEAVRPGGKVWVVRDKKLAGLHVRKVPADDDRVIILAGDLAEGDRVVVSPLSDPVDGMEVKEMQREKAV